MDPKARELHCIRLERLAKSKYFRFLGPFVSYEENSVARTTPEAVFTALHFLQN
jgi:hypothetical protein